jgi:hypothetical protein
MEMICSSETLADFQRAMWHFITEDSTLRNYRCEHLKSYTIWNHFHIYSTLSLLPQGNRKTGYVVLSSKWLKVIEDQIKFASTVLLWKD